MISRLGRVGFLLLVAAGPACAPRGLQPGEGYVDVPGGRVWYRVVGSGTETPCCCCTADRERPATT